jgi:hypothetical protein
MSLEAKIEALTVAVEALTAALSATDAEVKTRKPRAKPEAPVVEAPVVEAPVVEAPVVEAPVVEEASTTVEAPVTDTPSETLVVDMEVLKAKFRQFMSARGSADARAVLTEFGVPPTGKLVDLPSDKYGAMHAKLCEELGA